MRLALVIAFLSVAARLHAQAPDAAAHALPIRFVDRPLTVPQGTLRIDQALVFDVERASLLNAPNAIVAGITDWLEVGVTWPYLRDPGVVLTARVAHSDVIDAGWRVQATFPAVTPGNTDLAISYQMVLRLAQRVRIATAVVADFLFTQRVQPIFRVPLQLVVNATDRYFFGLQGSLSVVDYHWTHGDVGFVFGHTPAATSLRPIGEVRLGATWLINTGFEATLAFSFFPTFMPTRW